MIKVNEKTVAYHEVEWGYEHFYALAGQNIVTHVEDEEEARGCAAMVGGAVKSREVFVTEWADAPA